MVYTIVQFTNIKGQNDLLNIAKNDGIAWSQEGEESLQESDDSLDEGVIAPKYIRYFPHHNDKFFCLFVECGINRNINVEIDEGYMGLILKIKIPPPPDSLLQKAGFQASSILLEAVEEEFTIETPKKISLDENTHEVLYEPSKEKPLWVVFKYAFDEHKVEAGKNVEINLTSLFQ
jgi:hypothetical protein